MPQARCKDAVDKGATVLVPGGRVDGPGAFFRSAVITGITPEMRVYTEEAFGPLGCPTRTPRVRWKEKAVEERTVALAFSVHRLRQVRSTASASTKNHHGQNGTIGHKVSRSANVVSLAHPDPLLVCAGGFGFLPRRVRAVRARVHIRPTGQPGPSFTPRPGRDRSRPPWRRDWGDTGPPGRRGTRASWSFGESDGCLPVSWRPGGRRVRCP
jgi:Aldehyde dehydrogenase family